MHGRMRTHVGTGRHACALVDFFGNSYVSRVFYWNFPSCSPRPLPIMKALELRKWDPLPFVVQGQVISPISSVILADHLSRWGG